MRLAFVTDYDSTDAGAQSGIGFHMAQGLAENGVEVRRVRLRASRRNRVASGVKKALHGVRGRRYIGRRSPARLTSYAHQVSELLTREPVDVVLTPNTIPLAHLQCAQPIVIWADTTARGLINFYPEHTGLASETVRDTVEADRLSLSRCAVAAFSSHWAADVATRLYGVAREKVAVVPYGANIESRTGKREVAAMVASRSDDVCRLAFVGGDWQRKGGAHVVEVARLLRERGVRSELTIIGPSRSELGELPDYVNVLARVPMTTEAGRRTIAKTLSESHFFVLPTVVDCCPIALAEASSFGLPCLTTNIAGIPTLVEDGITGRMFEPNAPPDAYASYIARVLSEPGEYERLAGNAFLRYDAVLNWRRAAAGVLALLEERCS